MGSIFIKTGGGALDGDTALRATALELQKCDDEKKVKKYNG